MEPGDQHGPFYDKGCLWGFFGNLAIGKENVLFVFIWLFFLCLFVLEGGDLEEGNY